MIKSFFSSLIYRVISLIMSVDFFWNIYILQKTWPLKPFSAQTVSGAGNSPRVAYVIPGTEISGGIAVICEHVNRLLQRGWNVVMISEDNRSAIPWFPGQAVPVIPIRQINRRAFDILVGTNWSTAWTVMKDRRAGRKFYFVQSDERRFFSPGDHRLKRSAATYAMDLEFITMAGWLQHWLRKDFGREALLVPNGLNENIIYPDQPLEPRSGRVRVLLEGSIDVPYKGMADAFAAVDGLDCEVWCVSASGKPSPEWRCDRFFEQVPIDQMRRIYSSCDILLKMSRIESFCYPPLEMMACGGTAVVGQVTGIEEYVVDGYNALVVEQGDVHGARRALQTLIGDRGFREKLSANGRRTAERFRWDASIDMLEKIFSSA